ncbi:RNB domain-containing ribonuclease [Sanguibacter sp. HDW7]|uniref:RNB domain-containing ribonuclease n=1 Tax=Sanguibacter sp. HDW7 TaxID=2714931 RepID=UPI00140B3F80|nr:RNB domain-containing ribonuclease [Sanguibacter sp. HDW7]QIK84498.1 RNB domain-containing ribonuclease [Sanguibacter sp. HDW7]
MTRHTLRLATGPGAALAASFATLRAELDLPGEFPAAVVAEADEVAQRLAAYVAAPPAGVLDARDVPLVTIDPPGSMDLDQAVHIERDGTGFRVRYAIADVPGAVAPGGALDAETLARGTTVYGPGTRIPLHPEVLSEGVASLLPGLDRPALLWDIRLDERGEQTAATVRRSVVRSRVRLSYAQAQAVLDGTPTDRPADPVAGLDAAGVASLLGLLQTVGTLRQALEQARGGVSLDVPEQEAAVVDGVPLLEFRRVLPVEGWNAQISLLTGMAAARMMIDGGIGILRTLPPSDPRDLRRLRRAAAALGIDWPRDLDYPGLVATLEGRSPQHAAFMEEATSLFRGAGHLAFDAERGAPLPDDEDARRHAAIAAPYAHVTAPLRRLVDRFGLAICVALCADEEVPDAVRADLARLPEIMSSTGRRAAAFERGCLDAVEAAVLHGRLGDEFDAVCLEANEPGTKGEILIADPAVRAKATGAGLEPGDHVRVRLTVADVAARNVRFETLAPAVDATTVGSSGGA